MQRHGFAVVVLACVIVGVLAGAVVASYTDVDRYISNGLVLATVGAFKYSVSSLEAAVQEATSAEKKAEAETALGLVYYQAALEAAEKSQNPNAYLAKARDHYLNAIQFDANNVFLYGQVGDIYLAMGERERAKQAYQQALECTQDAVGANYGLAKIAIQLQQDQEAVAYLEKVLEVSPDHVEASIMLAKQLVKLGQVDKAIEKLKAAETFDSRVPELHYQLAVAYQLSGDPERAVHELERTLQLDPNNKQAEALMLQWKTGDGSN